MSEIGEQAPLPEQITEAPAYDPENPDHVRRWELAGRPALDLADGDGNFWRPTITKVLQGDGSYLAIPAPAANPVTDVEIMYPVFTDARRQAALFLDLLKAEVWDYLKNVAGIPPSEVTEAGVVFNLSNETGIGVQYDDFVKNGGHPVAAAALWNRILEVQGNYPRLTAPVLAIFQAALTPA